MSTCITRGLLRRGNRLVARRDHDGALHVYRHVLAMEPELLDMDLDLDLDTTTYSDTAKALRHALALDPGLDVLAWVPPRVRARVLQHVLRTHAWRGISPANLYRSAVTTFARHGDFRDLPPRSARCQCLLRDVGAYGMTFANVLEHHALGVNGGPAADANVHSYRVPWADRDALNCRWQCNTAWLTDCLPAVPPDRVRMYHGTDFASAQKFVRTDVEEEERGPRAADFGRGIYTTTSPAYALYTAALKRPSAHHDGGIAVFDVPARPRCVTLDLSTDISLWRRVVTACRRRQEQRLVRDSSFAAAFAGVVYGPISANADAVDAQRADPQPSPMMQYCFRDVMPAGDVFVLRLCRSSSTAS